MSKKPKSTFEREMKDPKFKKAYQKAVIESKIGGQSFYQCPAFKVTKIYQDKELRGYNLINPLFIAKITQYDQVIHLHEKEEMVKLIECLQDIIDINDKLITIIEDDDITLYPREHP